jgi:hypothetical protein
MNFARIAKQALFTGLVLGSLTFQPLVALANAEPDAVRSAQHVEESGNSRPADAFFVRVDSSTTTQSQSDSEWKYVPVRRIAL